MDSNKKKRLVFFIFYVFVLISSVSALTYKADDAIDFKESCTSDGAICNSSAACNLSMQFPNSTYVINNAVMTNKGNGDFNYTIPSNQASEVGEYSWDMYCCQVGTCAEGHGTIDVSNTGTKLTTGEAIIYVIMLLGAMAVLGFFIYASIKLEWKHIRNSDQMIVGIQNQRVYKLGAIFMSYVLMMWVLALIQAISTNFLIMTDIATFFKYFYLIMLYLAFPLLTTTVVLIFVTWASNEKLRKKLMRGFEIK